MKNTKSEWIRLFSDDKLLYYKDLLSESLNVYHYYNKVNILDNFTLQEIYKRVDHVLLILNTIQQGGNEEEILETLQKINDEFSTLFQKYGCKKIHDLLTILYGKNYSVHIQDTKKYNVLNKYFSPTQYTILKWTEKVYPRIEEELREKNTILQDEDMINYFPSLECFDIGRKQNSFIWKIYGLRVMIHNHEKKNTLFIDGILENPILDLLPYEYIHKKLNKITKYVREKNIYRSLLIESLTLKDILLYSLDEMYKKYIGIISYSKYIYNKEITTIIREFMNETLYNKRKTIISFILQQDKVEYAHLAYMLYDLLTKDSETYYSLNEQSMLYNSFSYGIKKHFKLLMKDTIDYTNRLMYGDITEIPLEQQICLLKVSENVKEKAISKLKEVRSKSEESASKARQYLEGLLKIPFGIYRREKILTTIEEIKNTYHTLFPLLKQCEFSFKDTKEFNILDIQCDLREWGEKIKHYERDSIDHCVEWLKRENRRSLLSLCKLINQFIRDKSLSFSHIYHSNKNKAYLYEHIHKFIHMYSEDKIVLSEFFDFYNKHTYAPFKKINLLSHNLQKMKQEIHNMEEKQEEIHTYLRQVRQHLDRSVYGHTKAKRQLERVIGQWITGKQTGYCFGFQGPPGVGKTSLAKDGLSNCLLDIDGKKRPFGFIALGGSCNGSTLKGHNYTYLGSTWGRIVDILMESKCMNPIIFIDELDKVSNTESGKEIIGILTHMVDSTQNKQFHDRYFNGIDIDLSNVLFIFSYNDRNKIDRILLDRIHEVKFSNLTLDEKVTIVYDYILPELYSKIDLHNTIEFPRDTIVYIIERYTNESGVRKLKELLYEIISEINLEVLERKRESSKIIVSEECIDRIYLSEYDPIYIQTITSESKVGLIHGLWANMIGQGGIIPIETSYSPSNHFLELKLTGMQGDVMKESMNVAKTLAYHHTAESVLSSLQSHLKERNCQGIHIHCPEGAVRKDGPSAGTAIAVCIYSLLNQRAIKNFIGITGEIDLQGTISRIGGLELKILGGIKAGITEFIYPKENLTDLDRVLKKHDTTLFKDIYFHPVSTFDEVLSLVFVE